MLTHQHEINAQSRKAEIKPPWRLWMAEVRSVPPGALPYRLPSAFQVNPRILACIAV